LSVSAPYKRLKQFVKDQCRSLERSRIIEQKLATWKTKLKSLLLPPNVFEDMGMSYWGPFNGHETRELEEIFELSKRYPKPLLIHVITKKGKGCAEAEEHPALFHGIGSGTVIGRENETANAPVGCDWSRAVSKKIESMARTDGRVVALTAAMEEGTRLGDFKKMFPDRYFDVGIAEGHMLTYAAGLAAGGMKPAVCIYSTFLQRAMDQLLHDICLQKMPVLLAVDRAGLNGEDGETHQGLLDMAWGRSIPGLVVCAPRDRVDLDFMMSGWLERDIPVMIRYPKGAVTESVSRGSNKTAPWGKAEILRQGQDACVMCIGAAVKPALSAADACEKEGLPVPTVADIRFASPIDWDVIDGLLSSHSFVLTAEDGYVLGGVGEAIAARAAGGGFPCVVRTAGVDAAYIAHATRDEQLEEQGLTGPGIAAVLEDFYGVSIAREAG
jgi:1-deoxy-D-xylulose-5-phosphate synthase